MIPLPDARGFDGWRRILWLDLALLVLVRRVERPLLTPLMRGLTRAGDTVSWLLLAGALASTGPAGAGHALRLALAAALALGLSQALKRACCRPRPSEGLCGVAALVEHPDAFSFPSGHTAVAAAVAVVLAGTGALGGMAAALAAGIGISRVYLGAHYPLDVAAGALVGAAAGLAVRATLPLLASGLAPLP